MIYIIEPSLSKILPSQYTALALYFKRSVAMCGHQQHRSQSGFQREASPPNQGMTHLLTTGGNRYVN